MKEWWKIFSFIQQAICYISAVYLKQQRSRAENYLSHLNHCILHVYHISCICCDVCDSVNTIVESVSEIPVSVLWTDVQFPESMLVDRVTCWYATVWKGLHTSAAANCFNQLSVIATSSEIDWNRVCLYLHVVSSEDIPWEVQVDQAAGDGRVGTQWLAKAVHPWNTHTHSVSIITTLKSPLEVLTAQWRK